MNEYSKSDNPDYAGYGYTTIPRWYTQLIRPQLTNLEDQCAQVVFRSTYGYAPIENMYRYRPSHTIAASSFLKELGIARIMTIHEALKACEQKGCFLMERYTKRPARFFVYPLHRAPIEIQLETQLKKILDFPFFISLENERFVCYVLSEAHKQSLEHNPLEWKLKKIAEKFSERVVVALALR